MKTPKQDILDRLKSINWGVAALMLVLVALCWRTDTIYNKVNHIIDILPKG